MCEGRCAADISVPVGAELPLGHGATPEEPVALVDISTWGPARIERLHDVDWAARRALPSVLEPAPRRALSTNSDVDAWLTLAVLAGAPVAKMQNWPVRLLIVEDDDTIADPLVRSLRAEHFDVEWVRTASGALNAPQADLVLLDLGLPDRDGAEVLRELRRRSPVPVIVVTARGQEAERVTGLNLGADDYVVKPFSFSELVARIWAVLRRTTVDRTPDLNVQLVGKLEIDHRSRVVRVDQSVITCTPKEYAILELLAQDPGSLVTRQELVDKVWGTNWYGTTKMIDVHVAALRKKLGRPELIETVRGVGYRLGADEEG